MIGPKLDPRSYTTLLLVVIASLLAFNLFAQLNNDTRPSAVSDNLSDADASREVARATERVADANQEIAKAISQLASAVAAIDFKIEMPSAGNSAPAAATAEPAGQAEPTEDEMKPEGKFEIK